MKITAIFPTRTFKLLIEFDEKEYRVLDIKDFFRHDGGRFADIRENIDLFLSVTLDRHSGVIVWSNEVDIDTKLVYEHSVVCKGL